MQQPTDFKLQPTPAFLNTVENDTARECCCSRASPNACLGISLCRYAGFRTRGVTRRSRSTPWGVMRTSSGCSSGVVHGESERGIRGNLATATLLQFFPIVEYVYARAQVPLLGAPVIRQAQRSVRCGPGPGVAPKIFVFWRWSRSPLTTYRSRELRAGLFHFVTLCTEIQPRAQQGGYLVPA